MQPASSFLLISLGLAVGAYAIFSGDPDSEANLAEVTRIAVMTDIDSGRPEIPADVQGRAGQFAASMAGAKAATAASAYDSQQPVNLKPWTAVVSDARQEMARDARSADGNSADYEASAILARDIQYELARVGCYDGRSHGVWDRKTRHAMAAFVAGANASLPTDRPDYILLALVQGHSGPACGQEHVVAGVAPDKFEKYTAAREAKERKAAERRNRERKQAEPQQVAGNPRPPVEREVLPWLTAEAEQAKVEQQTTTPATVSQDQAVTGTVRVTRQPPEGRMAIGGPKVESEVAPAQQAPVSGERKAQRPATADVSDPKPATATPPVKRKAKVRKYYANYEGRSSRRNPRRGSREYNLMLSLGGIF